MGSIMDIPVEPGMHIGLGDYTLPYPVDASTYNDATAGGDSTWYSTYPYGTSSVPVSTAATGNPLASANPFGSNLPILLIGGLIGLMLFRK
jgi:hypothetical protein